MVIVNKCIHAMHAHMSIKDNCFINLPQNRQLWMHHTLIPYSILLLFLFFCFSPPSCIFVRHTHLHTQCRHTSTHARHSPVTLHEPSIKISTLLRESRLCSLCISSLRAAFMRLADDPSQGKVQFRKEKLDYFKECYVNTSS